MNDELRAKLIDMQKSGWGVGGKWVDKDPLMEANNSFRNSRPKLNSAIGEALDILKANNVTRDSVLQVWEEYENE